VPVTSKVLRLFSTPVLIAEVDGAEELNAQLGATILERMKSDSGVVRSNRGGWHSKLDLFSWIGEAGQRLLKETLALANAHTNAVPGTGPLHWVVNAWANVNHSGDANAAHVHGGAYWSAVYYVRVGEGSAGKLVLHDPRMPALRMHAPMLRLKDAGPELIAELTPSAGQLIMFPSWLSHSVQPWGGNEPRISIAMNLVATAAPGGPSAQRNSDGQ
jgi:uncharacterized protein (TIGR02466 family)